MTIGKNNTINVDDYREQDGLDVTDTGVTGELCGALVVERGWSTGYGCRRERGHDGPHSRVDD